MADGTPPRSTTSSREPPAGPSRSRRAANINVNDLFGANLNSNTGNAAVNAVAAAAAAPNGTASYTASNSAANSPPGSPRVSRTPSNQIRAALNAAQAEGAANAAAAGLGGPRGLVFQQTAAEKYVDVIVDILYSENLSQIPKLRLIVNSPKWANYRVRGRPVFFRLLELSDHEFIRQALAVFMEAGLNINMPDGNGATILFDLMNDLETNLTRDFDAVEVNDYLEIARILLEQGADPSIRDRVRNTNAYYIINGIFNSIDETSDKYREIEAILKLLQSYREADMNAPGAPSRKRRRNRMATDPTGGPNDESPEEKRRRLHGLNAEAPNVSNSTLAYGANMNVIQRLQIQLKQHNARVARQREEEERQRKQMLSLLVAARDRTEQRRTQAAANAAAAAAAVAAAAGPGVGAPPSAALGATPVNLNAAAAPASSGAPPPPPPPPGGSTAQTNAEDPGAGTPRGGRRRTRRRRGSRRTRKLRSRSRR